MHVALECDKILLRHLGAAAEEAIAKDHIVLGPNAEIGSIQIRLKGGSLVSIRTLSAKSERCQCPLQATKQLIDAAWAQIFDSAVGSNFSILWRQKPQINGPFGVSRQYFADARFFVVPATATVLSKATLEEAST